MDIKFLKELNEQIKQKSEAQKALDEAGIEFDLGDDDMDAEMSADDEMPGDDMEDDDEFDIGSDEELERIADDYREDAEDGMDDDDLRDAIGDDLEQLEYEPEDIPDAMDKIMVMLGREPMEDDGEDLDMEDDDMDDDEFPEGEF